MVPRKEVSLLLLNNLSAALSDSDLVYILRGRTAVLCAELYLNIVTWRLTKLSFCFSAGVVNDTSV